EPNLSLYFILCNCRGAAAVWIQGCNDGSTLVLCPRIGIASCLSAWLARRASGSFGRRGCDCRVLRICPARATVRSSVGGGAESNLGQDRRAVGTSRPTIRFRYSRRAILCARTNPCRLVGAGAGI